MRARLVAFAASAALVVGACLGEAPATETPTQRPTPEPTATTTRYELDTKVWYAGLVLTFDRATAVLDPGGGEVTIGLQIGNPGPDPLGLSAPIRLTAGGQGFEVRRGTELPDVEAGGNETVSLPYDVIGLGSVDAAVIRVGASEDHQALVPLKAGGVQLLSLEPVAFDASGSATAGDLAIAIHTGLLRWDLPDWGEELPRASEALTVTYDVTYSGKFSGGFPFTGENIALRLPDGSVVEPRKDGRSQSLQVIAAGATAAGLASRFEIPAGARGAFALIVKNGSAEGAVEFSLPG
jgi:hypothetical protein